MIALGDQLHAISNGVECDILGATISEVLVDHRFDIFHVDGFEVEAREGGVRERVLSHES